MGLKRERKKERVAQLQAHIDEVQMEKQVLGMPVHQHTNEQLFMVDREPQTVTARMGPVRRPLRVDEILKPHSKINVPPQKALKKAMAKVKLPKAKTVEKETEKTPHYDPWANDHELVTVVKPAKKTLSAVKVIPAGASYHPEPSAHAQLIQEAEQQEIKRVSRYEGFKAQVAPILNPTSVTVVETGQQPWHEPLQSEEESTPSEAVPNSGVRPKSKAERRREVEKRQAKQQRLEEKRSKQILHQLDHLRSLRSKVKKEAAAALKPSRKPKKDVPRLGPNRLVEAPIAVQLEEELAGSLRSLKPEGHLLVDRFRSLQERGIIEPRHRIKAHRRYQLKRFEKHGHKQFK